MSEWTDLPEDVRGWMDFIGNYAPTVRAASRELKGMAYDTDDGERYGSYLDADEMRAIAAACVVVADWLDARADAANPPLTAPSAPR